MLNAWMLEKLKKFCCRCSFLARCLPGNFNFVFSVCFKHFSLSFLSIHTNARVYYYHHLKWFSFSSSSMIRMAKPIFENVKATISKNRLNWLIKMVKWNDGTKFKCFSSNENENYSVCLFCLSLSVSIYFKYFCLIYFFYQNNPFWLKTENKKSIF